MPISRAISRSPTRRRSLRRGSSRREAGSGKREAECETPTAGEIRRWAVCIWRKLYFFASFRRSRTSFLLSARSCFSSLRSDLSSFASCLASFLSPAFTSAFTSLRSARTSWRSARSSRLSARTSLQSVVANGWLLHQVVSFARVMCGGAFSEAVPCADACELTDRTRAAANAASFAFDITCLLRKEGSNFGWAHSRTVQHERRATGADVNG